MKPFPFSFILIGLSSLAVMNQGLFSQSRLPGEKEPLRITLEQKDFDNVFQLSKHVKSLRMVPLETRAECLINQINQMEFTRDKIFILQKKAETGILVFDQEGKFLYSIGRKGKGPGNQSIETISDKKSDDIFLMDYLNFTTLSTEGEWAVPMQAVDLVEKRAKILEHNSPFLSAKIRKDLGLISENDNPVVVLHSLK